jgi:hypothetical protein
MGMHLGYLAAHAPVDRFMIALEERTGSFIRQGDARPLDRLDLEASDDGFPIAVSELGGSTYLLDSSFVLSSDPDLIVSLSGELSGVVVGAGAETTSGSYWLVAARDGELLRFHQNSAWGQTESFDRGEPLTSEALDHLEDVDGFGLRQAMSVFSFDIDSWLNSGQLVPYVWTYERPPEPGLRRRNLQRSLRPTASIHEGSRFRSRA